jgi:hypothetical protein
VTNRIANKIIERRKQIEQGIKPDGSPITGDLVMAEKQLDNTVSDVVAYQDLKNVAYLNGLLNVEEAQTIYLALGGEAPGPDGWGEHADLATKVVITNLMGELVTMRLRTAQESQPKSAKSLTRARA